MSTFIRCMTGAISCALVVVGAAHLHAVGQQPPAGPAAALIDHPAVLANTGRSPAGAFLVDFSKGYDPRTQYISDFDIDAEWMLMIFRDENVRFDEHGMTLAVSRDSGRDMPYTMSELQVSGFYGFGRYEVVMRSSGDPGVVSSFFTHTGEYHGDPHAEVDFEFLGSTPRQVHLNFFNEGRNDPRDIDLWFDASKGEHLYAFEWLPHAIVWYVDGVKVHEVTAFNSPVPIPTVSSRVMVNTWVGNRQTEAWVGSPTFESSAAFYRCMSHVPVGESGGQCSDTFTPPLQD